MTSSLRAALGLAVVMCAASAAPLSAQRVNAGEIQHRNNCRLAGQVLTLGQPANRGAWALQYIGSCGEEGGDVILQLWNSPPSSDSELQLLYYASIHVADERVFDVALVVVVQDPAAPAPIRLAALGTLVTYVRPDMLLNLEVRSRLEGLPPLQWDNVWGTVDHPALVEEEVSLPSDAYVGILELVQEFAGDGDAPALLRDSAYWLLGLYHFDR
jgi:hypothetical protein